MMYLIASAKIDYFQFKNAKSLGSKASEWNISVNYDSLEGQKGAQQDSF